MNNQVLFESTNNTISLRLRDHGLDVIPSSCTLNIYDQYGTALLEDKDITPGSDGTCTYIVEADITDELSENNRAMWTVIVSGVTSTHTTLFDVVLNIIRNELLDQDLFDECSALEEHNYYHSGAADSGTTTTLIDNELMNCSDDFCKGGLVEFVDGTNENNSRIITVYDASLGKVTWSTALGSSVDTTTKYILRKTFQRQINAAWEEMLNYIDNQGFRPALICNSEKLKTPHKFFALTKICYGLIKETGDSWHTLADMYEKKAYSLLSGLKFREASELEAYSSTETHVQGGFRR